MSTNQDFRRWGSDVVNKAVKAINNLGQRIDENFVRACEILLHCQGHVVVLGVGKSGHIGNKIAATLASTGTPSFFVHATEASHGDFGMITTNDVVLAISNSGKTNEILTLLPLIEHLHIPLISLSGDVHSPLAHQAMVNIDIGVSEEVGPLDLAPTCSTTATLVMGDALAIALLRARDFSTADFARTHPGGTLGKRLLLTVEQLMHSDTKIPRIREKTLLKDALLEMTTKRLGMTTIVDADDRLLGIFTDGDLRRAIEHEVDVMQTSIDTLMSTKCKTTHANKLVFEVFNEMEQHKITAMPVINNDHHVIGVIHLHDILQAGVI